MTVDTIKTTLPVISESYFPTPVCTLDLPQPLSLNKGLLENILKWQDADPDGIVRSNFKQAGSWHSPIDMHQRQDFKELTDAILAMAQQVFDQQHYHPDYPPLIDSMWANINPHGGFNRSHSHPDTLWSGVYYVQTPAQCGRICFYDPRSQARVITPVLSATAEDHLSSWPEVYFEPAPGRMILFPAWLQHDVEPNLSELPGDSANRISVSFNILQGSPHKA